MYVLLLLMHTKLPQRENKSYIILFWIYSVIDFRKTKNQKKIKLLCSMVKFVDYTVNFTMILLYCIYYYSKGYR